MSKLIDLKGQRFGRLTVIEKSDSEKNGNAKWLCLCECGNRKVISGYNLRQGYTISCGCYHNEIIKKNIKGQRFGRLTVLQESGRSNSQGIKWLCECDCGNKVIVRSSSLINGTTKSCGCYQKNVISKMSTKHNCSRTQLYRTWRNIKSRCNNPNTPRFKDYGGRGIKVTKEWENFECFKNWALNNGYSDELTIDRINVNGDYEPSNCRWITNKEQQLNRRNNHLITYNGTTKTLTEWAIEMEMKPKTLRSRIIDYQWSIDKALTTPVKSYKRRNMANEVSH